MNQPDCIFCKVVSGQIPSLKIFENEHVLEKAKSRADSVMQLMFGPIAKSINRNYKVQVVFQDAPTEMTEDELRRRF